MSVGRKVEGAVEGAVDGAKNCTIAKVPLLSVIVAGVLIFVAVKIFKAQAKWF